MVYVLILTDTGFEESVMKEEKASMKFIPWVDYFFCIIASFYKY